LLAELICQAAQGIRIRVRDNGAKHGYARNLLDILQFLAELCLGSLRAQKVKFFIKFLEPGLEHFRF